MYYTGLSGIVRSFNYGIAPNSDTSNGGTREIANLNYGVCIAMTTDHCSIRWSQTSDSTSFSVSGMTDPNVAGDALQGTDCVNDFVVIPNPIQNNMPANVDRFCGNAFVPKISRFNS